MKPQGMTEELWLKSRDLKRMFARLGKPTELVRDPRYRRKNRLFGVAALRHSWKEMGIPEAVHHGIEVAEQFADGLATDAELQAARIHIQSLQYSVEFSLPASCVTHEDSQFTGYDAACHAHPDLRRPNRSEVLIANSIAHAQLLRDIFGNPFRPVTFDPVWRTSTAVALAKQMYDTRDFGAMPILADALQDAGCTSDDILNHCRDPHATHVRGCWVVDLVMGKS
jgi:hypothetical protein